MFLNLHILINALEISDTFDIATNKKIHLIDFNPFNAQTTKAALFKWEDIYSLIEENNFENSSSENLKDELPEFRFLGENPGYVPNTIQSHCVPEDLKELCSKSRDLSLIDIIQKVF